MPSILRHENANPQDIFVGDGEKRSAGRGVGSDETADIDVALCYHPIEGRHDALVRLQPFEPGDLGFLRLDIGLRHIDGGVLRSEIIAVLVAGLLCLPALPHERRETVVGDVGERARRLELFERGLHLLKLRPRLRELVVDLRRRNDSQEIAILDLASNVHKALRDVPALAGENGRGIESLRRRRKSNSLGMSTATTFSIRNSGTRFLRLSSSCWAAWVRWPL